MNYKELIGNREIKFRAWDKEYQKMIFWNSHLMNFDCEDGISMMLSDCYENHLHENRDIENERVAVMQYTGLKDKSGLTCVYEGDIISGDGEIKGNVFEMDKGETDIVIQGFGTKDWFETYNEAIYRGLKNA